MTDYSLNLPISPENKLIPIYNSRGDIGAFLLYPYIFNTQGEWIGWVAGNRTVFSVHGHQVGILSKDPRILRKREVADGIERRKPPDPPPPIRVPATLPLAPQLPEITFNMIDVLDEAPDLMPPIDFGDLRDDMD